MESVPYIADLIARPRRIIKLSPAKKRAIAEYEETTARAVQMRKVEKLAASRDAVSSSSHKSASIEPDPSAVIEFDRDALASIMRSFSSLIDDDEDMREQVIKIAISYLRHEAGSGEAYRDLRRMLGDQKRRGSGPSW